MTKRKAGGRLDARVWPGILETLVPATDRRLVEIMAWAEAHDQKWLFDFLEARAANLRADTDENFRGKIPPEDHLAQRFGLTVAQARVLSAFLAGQNLREIARLQGVSITTVRTHFVQMREKLGARDQADVIRIALLGGDAA
ncbi:MAG: LuxR C-terminal-related transcriptional regulator [Parvibaculum sp.]|uniref:helix-turn-helix transcriptional regulator n=1 Tax=Parvibaculum sp. TaxID=2024848 RepID=UPI00349FE2C3